MNVLRRLKGEPMTSEERPLSRKAHEAIEAHYVEVTELRDQRDRALAEKEKVKELITNASHRMNGLMEEINELKSRCTTYQIERDEAVAKLANLEGKMSLHISTLRGSITNLEEKLTP